MIPVKNIYYMLAYAFQELEKEGYRRLGAEPFEGAADLAAAILVEGVSYQLKRGLARGYRERTEALRMLRGRLDISEIIRTGSRRRGEVVCSHDEFLEDVTVNQILKTTMVRLIPLVGRPDLKRQLRLLLRYFRHVSETDLAAVNWSIPYDRAGGTYGMLMGICRLIREGMLQTEESGRRRLMAFDDAFLCRLYEKFILAYYRKHFPALQPKAAQIPWCLDDGRQDRLPLMQSDIFLQRGEDVLIIDAKYYSRTMQEHYGRRSVRSNNLYQIFTYVKNQEASMGKAPHHVSGMLLYAGTDEAVQPDEVYAMSGNTIAVKMLDLNCDFPAIRRQLDAIKDTFFPE